MKAKVLAEGILLTDDGSRFTYSVEDVKSDGVLKMGDEVDFVADGGGC